MAPLGTAARLGGALILVSLLGSCAGELDSTAGCTLIGCSDSATVYPGVPLSFTQLQKSHITVCRGQECFSGDFSTLARRNSTGPYNSLELSPPGASPSVTVYVEEPHPELLSLNVTWHLPPAPSMKQPQDGDVYRVTLVDGAGVTLVNVEEMVNYAVSRPNGPDCEPACHRAVIDKRS